MTPTFFVLTDFGDRVRPGLGTDNEVSFDEAVDAFAEQMGDGLPSAVFEIVRQPGKAPMAEDCTAKAVDEIVKRRRAKGFDEDTWEDWLLEATGTSRAEVEADARAADRDYRELVATERGR